MLFINIFVTFASMKSEISHPLLGRLILKTRRNARHFSYRILKDYIEISGPLFSEKQMIHLLLQKQDEILDIRNQLPDTPYNIIKPEVPIICPECSIIVHEDTNIKFNNIQVKKDYTNNCIHILLHPNHYHTNDYQKQLNKIITIQLQHLAQTYLIPQAKEIISKHNFPVTQLKISKAKRAWGRCSSKGIVSLSCYLMLVSTELRESVIYHEMAHLYHMNHSSQFYELLLQWMPDYKEKTTQLNSIRSPLFYAHK